FLRKDAHLDVDRPLVVRDERLDALEPTHADTGIDLDLRAHARRAVQDAVLERARGARADVLDRHALLERRHAQDRAQGAALLRRAALDDARLVQVDVGLDEARTGKPTLRIEARPLGREPRRDRRDPAVLDADIHRGAAAGPRVANDEIQAFRSSDRWRAALEHQRVGVPGLKIHAPYARQHTERRSQRVQNSRIDGRADRRKLQPSVSPGSFHMSAKRIAFAVSASFLLASSLAVRAHEDEAPGGKLGRVSFPTSCAAAVQPTFERAVAMLHSFWYNLAEKTFADILAQDPGCTVTAW